MKKWNCFNIANFQQKRFKGYMLPYTSRQKHPLQFNRTITIHRQNAVITFTLSSNKIIVLIF